MAEGRSTPDIQCLASLRRSCSLAPKAMHRFLQDINGFRPRAQDENDRPIPREGEKAPAEDGGRGIGGCYRRPGTQYALFHRSKFTAPRKALHALPSD